jgi:hypothetical protein
LLLQAADPNISAMDAAARTIKEGALLILFMLVLFIRIVFREVMMQDSMKKSIRRKVMEDKIFAAGSGPCRTVFAVLSVPINYC